MSVQPLSTPVHDPLAGSSFFYQGRSAKYIIVELNNTSVLPSLTTPITDEVEEGLLVGFELATNKAEVLLQVIVYGDNSTTPRAINNFTITDMRRLGRGITPGDSEKNPDGRSKDPMGQDNPLYPWIARFKDEELADDTGYADKFFVARFTPAVYVPYKRILITMTNTNSTDTATIIHLSITRIVFEDRAQTTVVDKKPYADTESQAPVKQPSMPSEDIFASQAPIDEVHHDVSPDEESVV
jgi:hypothetical protein